MLVVKVLTQNMQKDPPVVKTAVMLEQFTYANMFTMSKVKNLESFVIVKVSNLKKNQPRYAKSVVNHHESSGIITI